MGSATDRRDLNRRPHRSDFKSGGARVFPESASRFGANIDVGESSLHRSRAPTSSRGAAVFSQVALVSRHGAAAAS